ncbi:hypothetical protein ACA910_011073 [Epithemia clementina (nom. ined.)]
MNKFVAILLASLVSVQAIDRIIGKPTGNLDPRKKRQLESVLKQKNRVPTNVRKEAKDSPRDLQYQYKYYDDYYYESEDYEYGSGIGGYGSGSGNGYAKKYDDYVKKYDDYYPKYGKKGGKSGKGGKKKATAKVPIINDNACELFVTEEHFRIPPYNVSISPPDANTSDVGATYIWTNQYLEDDGSRQNLDATVTGVCTRTQGYGSEASGQCTFTVVDASGNYDQLQFSGVLFGVGGTLLVTGGSGQFVGLIGDATISIYPVGDPFDDAAFYDVHLVIGLIVCPPQYDTQVFGGTDDYYYPS